MLSRSTLLAGLFTLTLLAGAGLFYFHHNFDVSGTLKRKFLELILKKRTPQGCLKIFVFIFLIGPRDYSLTKNLYYTAR